MRRHADVKTERDVPASTACASVRLVGWVSFVINRVCRGLTAVNAGRCVIVEIRPLVQQLMAPVFAQQVLWDMIVP